MALQMLIGNLLHFMLLAGDDLRHDPDDLSRTAGHHLVEPAHPFGVESGAQQQHGFHFLPFVRHHLRAALNVPAMSALTCWLSLRKRQNPSSMYTTAWRRERHSRSCWAEADLRRWYSLPKMANRSFLVMCCDNSPYCCFQTAKLMLLIQKKEKMNVFVKPDEQRPSLLGLCHGE